MDNNEKYVSAFKDAFGVDENTAMNLKFQDIPEWDSVGHMLLISKLEEAFDIMFETDDIINLNSFEKGKELLAHYDVVI